MNCFGAFHIICRIRLVFHCDPLLGAQRVGDDGVALEVNTQSVRDRLAGYDIYLLERYYGLGGRLITLGSDAHSTDRIANGFGIAAVELRRIGFKSACYIENRAIKSYKL